MYSIYNVYICIIKLPPSHLGAKWAYLESVCLTCKAKSGMGKTAVFVLACLQQIDASEKAVKILATH